MSRIRIALVTAGAALVLAVAASLAFAARSHDAPAAGGCPVTALSCAPGQNDPPDSGPPRDGRTTASVTPGGDAADASGMRRDPATTAAATPDPSGSASGGASCASAQACGFPGPHSTGPRLPMSPHRTGAMRVTKDGTVISRWDITGSLDVYADDVTVIDSRITSDNWWGVNLRPGHKGLRVLHTEITAVPGAGPDNGGVDYGVSNMGTSPVEVGWCDISVFGNALSMGQGDLHDNYVHDIAPFRDAGGQWQHTDAVISDGGATGRLTVRHNTLLNATPVDQGASAALGLFADAGPVRDVVVDGNWLAGGAYALYAGGKGSSGISVTDNVFSTQYHPSSGVYGAVAAWDPSGAGNTWRGNRFSDGRVVTPQAEG